MREVEELCLLALRPLLEVTDEMHIKSGQDSDVLPMAKKLIDATSIISQAIYKTNIIRVSSMLSINLYTSYIYTVCHNLTADIYQTAILLYVCICVETEHCF